MQALWCKKADTAPQNAANSLVTAAWGHETIGDVVLSRPRPCDYGYWILGHETPGGSV